MHCKIQGCERQLKANGLCDTHDARRRRNGDPLIVQRVRDFDMREVVRLYFGEMLTPDRIGRLLGIDRSTVAKRLRRLGVPMRTIAESHALHYPRGPRSANWGEGPTITVEGYATREVEGRLVYVHRQVMQRKLRRQLRRDEIVHHKNGDKLDNRPGNLALTSRAEHARLHHSITGG